MWQKKKLITNKNGKTLEVKIFVLEEMTLQLETKM